MLTEQTACGEKIEVLGDGSLQVRDTTFVLRDGVRDMSFPPRFHRYVLRPGDNLAGKDARIVALANAVWTDTVISAYRTAQAALHS